MDDDEVKGASDEGSRQALRAGRAALNKGDAAAALPLLEAAAAAAPRDVEVLALLARALGKLKRPAQARAVWRRVLEQDPTHELARKRGGVERADAPAAGLEGAGRARWAQRATRKKARAVAALPVLEAATAETPNDLAALGALAHALGEAGQSIDMEAVNRRILEQDPTNARAQTQLGEAAWKRGDRVEALKHIQAAADAHPEDAKVNLRLGRALVSEWRPDEANVAFQRVIAVEPDNWAALVGAARIALVRGDREEAVNFLRAANASQPGNPLIERELKRLDATAGEHDWRSEVLEASEVLGKADAQPGARLLSAQVLLTYGITDIIRSELTPAEAATSPGRRILQMARQLDQSGLSQPSRPAGDAFDPEMVQINAVTGVVERLQPGAETLVLVFAGRRDRAFLSFDVLHRLIRRTGASQVYLRDLEQNFYHGGIVGLGADFAATTEALRALMARSGARRLLTFGNCIGSYGALRFGLALGAEAALCLSPRVGPLAIQVLSAASRANLLTLAEATSQPSLDPTSYYLVAGAAAPRVTLVAGAGAEPEATFARDMAARVPGVVYAAMPGIYKECFGDILARGLLTPMIESFVADGSVSPNVLEGMRRPTPRDRNGSPATDPAETEASP